MGNLEILSENTVKCIGRILNKEYTDIRVAEHKLYRNMGTSVYMKNKYEMGYSEANAGSGEIAVVQLVRRIEKAKDYSLVLLDEPEVSLHPGAQENLKEYLLEAIKTKKLQVVISTHSPTLIKGLPSAAIKLFKTNEYGKFYVQENINYEEAKEKVLESISSRKAYNKLLEFVSYQGGNINELPKSNYIYEVKSDREGYLTNIHSLEIAKLSSSLGSGRKNKEDKIDYSAGIIINKNINDKVNVGDTVLTLYTNREVPSIDKDKLFTIDNNINNDIKLIYEVIK